MTMMLLLLLLLFLVHDDVAIIIIQLLVLLLLLCVIMFTIMLSLTLTIIMLLCMLIISIFTHRCFQPTLKLRVLMCTCSTLHILSMHTLTCIKVALFHHHHTLMQIGLLTCEQ